MAGTQDFIPLIFQEVDAALCYQQLAAWSDYGCRHRTTKYFYEHAKRHFCWAKHFAKLANDIRMAVQYPAIQAPSRGALQNADMLQWFDMAYKLEQGILANMEKVAASGRDAKSTVVVAFLDGYIEKTGREVAHLYRKVEMLKEAGSDAAALQSFDHRLM